MGWVAALKDNYRLIVMDARGHGLSDKPHEPDAYRMDLLVGDFTAVLDELGIRQSHFLGYSMGGWIGFGIAKFAPERVTSLILGGAVGMDPDPHHPAEWSERLIGMLRKGREAQIAALRERAEQQTRVAQKPSALEEILPHRLRLASESDPEALIAMLSFQQKELLRIPEEVLPHLAVPCLLFVGEADDDDFKGAKAASELITGSRFVSFPGVAHFEAFARPDLWVPAVLRFLAEVDRGHKSLDLFEVSAHLPKS
jgi:pimeloyl-ACP methyl ester carboxylesterase